MERILACGLEVLERDHDVLTAPTRVAVSDHAFVIDGWIEMRRSDEVTKALEPFCLYTESDQFELIAGGGGHGHSDHHHHQEMPPISYQERITSKPMELLTDAVGRPAYGRGPNDLHDVHLSLILWNDAWRYGIWSNHHGGRLDGHQELRHQ